MDYASTINDLVLSRQKGDILESSGGSIEVGLHFNDREAVPKILRSFEVPFMVSFPGLSESDILEMEQHIARPIPDPYKNFLSQANGGFFFQNAFCFFGFSDFRQPFFEGIQKSEPLLGRVNIFHNLFSLSASRPLDSRRWPRHIGRTRFYRLP